MYIYNLELTPQHKDTQHIQELFQGLVALSNSLYRQGHITNQHPAVPYLEGRLSMQVVAVSPEALKTQHRKAFVKSGWESLETLAQQLLKIVPAGQEPLNMKPCACEKPPFYILEGEAQEYSPIWCGGCYHFVPIYTLPETYSPHDPEGPGEGYDDVYFWRRYSQATYRLWFAGLAEETITHELSDYDSDLNGFGLNLAQRIEFLTGVQTYFFLPEFSGLSEHSKAGLEAAFKRPCASCGKPWLLEQPLHNRYHFCCTDCQLLSQLSPEVQDALQNT